MCQVGTIWEQDNVKHILQYGNQCVRQFSHRYSHGSRFQGEMEKYREMHTFVVVGGGVVGVEQVGELKSRRALALAVETQ